MSMPYIFAENQIAAEMAPGYKPVLIDSGFDSLPLSSLSDRDFELLSYSLAKAEISASLHPKFTNIALMQGVGERGRDCVLYQESRIAGLIQCKKYIGRINKTQVLKELIKFALFALLDNAICPDPSQFNYYLYVSSDFTEPAIDLLFKYRDKIRIEISSGVTNKHLAGVVEEYEAFRPFRDNLPTGEVNEFLQKISVEASIGVDLTRRLYAQPEILRNFFNVKMVIAVEEADQLLRKALEDGGIRFLTDSDLNHIQQRITSAKSEHRVSLGFVEFYGFSVDFFKSLKRAEFKELIERIADVRLFLDAKLLTFLQSEITNRVFDEITAKLLHTGKIHPFSVGLAAPYLVKRLSPTVASSSIPGTSLAKHFPGDSKSRDEIVKEVSDILFDSSDRVMHGDYSQLVGDAPTIEIKKKLYAHINQGFLNIQDAKDRLNLDLPVIMPVLDKIEADIGDLISSSRTVMISDSSFLNDKGRSEKMIKSLDEIGELRDK